MRGLGIWSCRTDLQPRNCREHPVNFTDPSGAPISRAKPRHLPQSEWFDERHRLKGGHLAGLSDVLGSKGDPAPKTRICVPREKSVISVHNALAARSARFRVGWICGRRLEVANGGFRPAPAD
jgi:hypothetical protein